MKKNICSVAMLLATLMVAQTTHAGWQAQPVTITGYYVWDGGSAYIKTTNHQNSEGCESNMYIALNTDAKNFSAIWAQVLTAHTTGSPVSVHLSGCLGPYPKAMIPSSWVVGPGFRG